MRSLLRDGPVCFQEPKKLLELGLRERGEQILKIAPQITQGNALLPALNLPQHRRPIKPTRSYDPPLHLHWQGKRTILGLKPDDQHRTGLPRSEQRDRRWQDRNRQRKGAYRPRRFPARSSREGPPPGWPHTHQNPPLPPIPPPGSSHRP